MLASHVGLLRVSANLPHRRPRGTKDGHGPGCDPRGSCFAGARWPQGSGVRATLAGLMLQVNSPRCPVLLDRVRRAVPPAGGGGGAPQGEGSGTSEEESGGGGGCSVVKVRGSRRTGPTAAAVMGGSSQVADLLSSPQSIRVSGEFSYDACPEVRRCLRSLGPPRGRRRGVDSVDRVSTLGAVDWTAVQRWACWRVLRGAADALRGVPEVPQRSLLMSFNLRRKAPSTACLTV